MMEKRVLGTSDVTVSPIIMGLAPTVKTLWEDAKISKVVRTAFDAGISTFDTAESYGTEPILGQVLSKVRDKVVLATKISSENLAYNHVIEACESSLQKMNTDYIDIYQIHWPSGFSSAGKTNAEVIPVEETMTALNDLKKQGKIRAIGVCNFSRSQIAEATQYGRIDSLQISYSLFWRYAEKDLIPYCLQHEISVLAFSPLAQGLLTGKAKPGNQYPKTDYRSRNKLFLSDNYRRSQLALEKLRILAANQNISLSNLAIAWLIAQNSTCAIAGASNSEQVLSNVKAADINFSDSDLREIDVIGRIVTEHLDDSPIQWEALSAQDLILAKIQRAIQRIQKKLEKYH